MATGSGRTHGPGQICWRVVVGGSSPLAPAGLNLSADARFAIRRQCRLSDLCAALSPGLSRGLTRLEGVNAFTAFKSHSRGRR